MTKPGLPDELIRAYVGTAWTPTRSQGVEQGIARKRRRQNKARVVGAITLALVAGGWWAQARWLTFETPTVAELQDVVPANAMQLADGTLIESPEAGLGIRDLVAQANVSADETRVRLRAAGVKISRPGGRVARVQVREIAVEVLAATFVVAQAQGQLTVAVHEGQARVSWPGGRTTVKAGEEFIVPLASQPSPEILRPKPAVPGWQNLARRGRFDEAYVALQDALVVQGGRAVPDEPGVLLLAADAARLSHHPDQAVPHLQRFISHFAGDPRASMAAFTLGLVLLEELGRPREAARAFAQSRNFAPQGDLAEDALARHAEAWFRAGDSEQAKRAAEDYVQHFPHGRRARAVKRFGALE